MTAFSSGLKVLMISAQGTEERGQEGEKCRVKECKDKRASRGRNRREEAAGHESSPGYLQSQRSCKKY